MGIIEGSVVGLVEGKIVKVPSLNLSAYTANISPKQKVVLGVVFGVLVVVAYWQFLLGSEWTAWSEAQGELNRLNAELEQTRQVAGQRPRLEREVKALELQLQRTLQQLPTEKEIPSLLKRVAGLGQEANLEITLFRPGTTVVKEFYTEVPVQLKVMGTYHDLGVLFERLGRLERIVNVGDLIIRPVPKDQQAEKSIQAEFGVVTYTYSGTAGTRVAEGAKATQ